MKHPAVIAALFSVALALPLDAQESGREITADTVLAKVGEVEITLGHMVALRQQLPEQFQKLPDQQLFDGVLQQLIDQQLFAERALADGPVPKAVELSLENNRRIELSRISIDRVLSPVVSEYQLKQAYDARFGTPEIEYNAAHILVATRAEAGKIATALQAGDDFATLARKKSTDPASAQGGNLGWFLPDQMVAEFADAVAKLAIGEISGPVESQYGWHVIKLIDRRDVPVPSFEESREQLEWEIKEKRFDDLHDALEKEFPVTMSIDGVPLDALRNDDLLEQ